MITGFGFPLFELPVLGGGEDGEVFEVEVFEEIDAEETPAVAAVQIPFFVQPEVKREVVAPKIIELTPRERAESSPREITNQPPDLAMPAPLPEPTISRTDPAPPQPAFEVDLQQLTDMKLEELEVLRMRRAITVEAPAERTLEITRTAEKQVELTIGDGPERIALTIEADHKSVRMEAKLDSPELAIRLVEGSVELRDALKKQGLDLTAFQATTRDGGSPPSQEQATRDDRRPAHYAPPPAAETKAETEDSAELTRVLRGVRVMA